MLSWPSSSFKSCVLIFPKRLSMAASSFSSILPIPMVGFSFRYFRLVSATSSVGLPSGVSGVCLAYHLCFPNGYYLISENASPLHFDIGRKSSFLDEQESRSTLLRQNLLCLFIKSFYKTFLSWYFFKSFFASKKLSMDAEKTRWNQATGLFCVWA